MKNIITIVSLIWLVALTSLASVACYLNNAYSLPIAKFLPALLIALPPLSGIALKTLEAFQQRNANEGSAQYPSRLTSTITTACIILETVLATLASTHLAPTDSLSCSLQERWKRMYVDKDATSIQRIQDAFNCCGFRSPRDMAFPFPQGHQGADTCMMRYDRHASCMNPWAGLERRVATMLFLVPVGLFLWKVALYAMARQRDDRLPSAIRLPLDNDDNVVPNLSHHRQAIAYRVLDEENAAHAHGETGPTSHSDRERETAQPAVATQGRQENVWNSG